MNKLKLCLDDSIVHTLVLLENYEHDYNIIQSWLIDIAKNTGKKCETVSNINIIKEEFNRRHHTIRSLEDREKLEPITFIIHDKELVEAYEKNEYKLIDKFIGSLSIICKASRSLKIHLIYIMTVPLPLDLLYNFASVFAFKSKKFLSDQMLEEYQALRSTENAVLSYTKIDDNRTLYKVVEIINTVTKTAHLLERRVYYKSSKLDNGAKSCRETLYFDFIKD